MAKEPNIKELERAFNGDLDLVLFFLCWIKHERNASKAYLELNPSVDPASAAVLGSRQLKKVNVEAVLEVYGVGLEKYFTQLRDGLDAVKSDMTGQVFPDHKTRDLYHTKLGKILGIEKGGNELAPNVQNNYFNLTDEQLDQLIESKRRKIGATEADTGEGEENGGQSA